MEKTMKARVQHKHDVEANWLKATNFTPLVSEIIVYDPDENYDYPRIKIGDGKTNINSLPFITVALEALIDTLDTDKLDASKLLEAINDALAQAKESGEFDGEKGEPGKDGKDGADGKSAYQYAQDGGYTGTEAEFTDKLARDTSKTLTINGVSYDGSQDVNINIEGTSGSGIHIDPEPPEDPNVKLWIDTDEDVAQTFIKAPETAEVGQTIVVKAVDENGKPTEWESANLPSGDTVVTITSGTTEEDTTFFEFTDLPDCKSYVFSATIPKYATYSGVSVIVNDVLCLVGGNYFVHPSCNKEINIEIRHVGTTGLLISGNSAQLNNPYNHDPLVSGYVTTPNRAAKIEKLKIALSDSNSLILSGAVYRLEGIGVV